VIIHIKNYLKLLWNVYFFVYRKNAKKIHLFHDGIDKIASYFFVQEVKFSEQICFAIVKFQHGRAD